MSKILLIKPRFIEGFWFQPVTQPLGLMYIGAMLKKAGHDPRIHDCIVDYEDFNILKQTLVDWRPDFIGISIIITELEAARKILVIIREIFPEIPVFFGGPWPTGNPEEAIKVFGADFVVLGEGEFVLPQLIEAINNDLPTESIHGTASRANGKVKINERRFLTEDELDKLPFPAWELLDHELYAKAYSMANVGYRFYMPIVTSRGCPYRCAYCHQTMGKVFRRRTPESVLTEIETLSSIYGFKDFEIIDDCFNLDRERMKFILTGIRDRIGKVKLHFPNALRSDMLENDDISLLKEAGTASAAFAIETANSRLQKMIHKNLDIEKAAKAIEASVKIGIYSIGYFMIGFPTEKYEEAYNTVEFAARTSLHRAAFLTPIPYTGTELSKMAAADLKKKYDTLDPRIMNYQSNALNISAMSDKELQEITSYAYRRFYMNPKRIFALLKMGIKHPEFFSLRRIMKMLLIINSSNKKREKK